ncbi:MAG: phosphate acyltransferase PlsX [Holosporales bacterium]|jgi:glycerol-3-phosphate acyltransferase PlsX|nr:phosphate acyltransferase PlsX [Holosporales bacterium]
MKRIALDIMGGDLGISASLPGLNRYISGNDCSDVAFDLFGDESEISRHMAQFPAVSAHTHTVHNTNSNVILASEKPAITVKKGRGTSMFEAISHVADGKADAVVSSGNTGAFMVLSKFLLGTLEHIDRPALVSILPNINGKVVMLDLGANTSCSSTKLVQFALMGQAVAQILLKIPSPRVGLLNIGTERSKGTETLEAAYTILEQIEHMDFVGFIEGTDIANGQIDVVVTDGFSGNISLKTMEGTVKYILAFLKRGFFASLPTKIGYLLTRRVFQALKDGIDPRINNGAPLVGLKKIAVKSHGNSDALGFENAIAVAVKFVRSNFVSSVESALARMKEKPE